MRTLRIFGILLTILLVIGAVVALVLLFPIKSSLAILTGIIFICLLGMLYVVWTWAEEIEEVFFEKNYD